MKTIIGILLLIVSVQVNAAPVYYHFAGNVKGCDCGDQHGLFPAAGIYVGAAVDVWWLIDFDSSGRFTRNNGTGGVIGDFYADFYLGGRLPLIWSNPDPLQIAEHNWGYSNVNATELIGGSGSDHNGMRTTENNPWDIGSIWEGYEYANDSSRSSMYFFDAVLVEVTSNDPLNPVPEPSTISLLGLALLGLVLRRKKVANNNNQHLDLYT